MDRDRRFKSSLILDRIFRVLMRLPDESESLVKLLGSF